ncbi:4-hydroxy-tetrahydrodipicolinate synthase [Thermohydrogenium kirishiense]|nr:4-hydroxy-tetrahydrodipicolinate synthase [Thermohydrogenium kirishiense]
MEFKGIITAMVTPMTQNQEVDYEATSTLVNHLINCGVNGLFILGTNGEFYLLSEEEKIAFARKVIMAANKRVPVIVGTGGNGTQEVINLSKRMEMIGADALSIITPYYITPTQEEVILHYKRISQAVSIPIILYNNPSTTGMTLDVETVAELSKVSNIIGIKDSSGKLENIKKYIEVTKDENFNVFSGSDSLILDTLLAGGVGAVAATSNYLTEIVVAIYKNFIKGDIEAARKAQEAIEPLREILKLGTIPSVLKKVMELSGIKVGPARFPAIEPTGEKLERIQKVVDDYSKIIVKGQI